MRDLRKFKFGCGSFAILGIGLAWVAWHWLTSSLCGNTTLGEVVSPDGTQRMVAFERDCGATSAFTTQVSLLSRSQSLPNDSGNVFVADCDHGAAPHGPGGGPELRMRWTSPHSAVIAHHPAARIHKSQRSLAGVHFEFPSFQ